MRGPNAPLLALAVCALLFSTCSGSFLQNFNVTWAGGNKNNVLPHDAVNGVQLRLDPSGGATFRSYSSYLYGVFSAYIKLVPKNSAGTVCAFFLQSAGLKSDEIDFEFLGNLPGRPYKIHTNVFVASVGAHEQQLELPFDPTLAFHKYEIVWTSKQITWMIDEEPIRVFKYYPGIYPRSNPMQVVGTIFDGSKWATDGGRVKINYADSPFLVTYNDFVFSGCRVSGTKTGPCLKNLQRNFWEAPQYLSWTRAQRAYYHKIQRNIVYNYCTDKRRHRRTPPECAMNTL